MESTSTVINECTFELSQRFFLRSYSQFYSSYITLKKYVTRTTTSFLRGITQNISLN